MGGSSQFETPHRPAIFSPSCYKDSVPTLLCMLLPAVPKWAPAVVAGAAVLSQVSPAVADDNVDSSVEAVIGAVRTAGGFVKSAISTADAGVKILQQGYEAAAPVIEQGVKVVSPVVQQAAKATADAATPALQAALPALSDAQKAIGSSLSSPTLDTVVGTTKEAITVATPFASKFISFLASSDPVTLGEYGLGALVVLYLTPSILGSFRGYAGEITAAQVLDALSDSSSVLIDIRTQKEKEGSGVPDVPSSMGSRCVEVEFAVTEDKKLRGSLRDPNSMEAAVTSMQIASLKRVSKGSKIILLDRYGGVSQTVAKELASKGFSKVYTVSGGFDGRGGWVQSKLQIKPAASVLSAPSVLPFTSTRKALAAPKA